MEINSSLKTVLKRLRLSPVVHTLPDRLAYAKKTKLPHSDFLELVLQDEIDRREHKSLQLRIDKAGFTEERTLEGFDWDAPVTFDRDRVRDLFSLGFLDRHEDVLFMGPVGVGKSHLAEALGHAACRAGKHVLFCRADELFTEFLQSRADHTTGNRATSTR
jgi:DNA replication protein DnaC